MLKISPSDKIFDELVVGSPEYWTAIERIAGSIHQPSTNTHKKIPYSPSLCWTDYHFIEDDPSQRNLTYKDIDELHLRFGALLLLNGCDVSFIVDQMTLARHLALKARKHMAISPICCNPEDPPLKDVADFNNRLKIGIEMVGFQPSKFLKQINNTSFAQLKSLEDKIATDFNYSTE